MSQRSPLVRVCLLAACVHSVPAMAQTLGTYETWESPEIRGSRWRGGVPFGGHNTGLENSRAIGTSAVGAPRLVLSLKQGTGADGAGRAAFNLLEIADPAGVNALDVSLSVLKVAARAGCPADGPVGPSRAGAVLILAGFNDGSSTGSDDRTGDYLALLDIGRGTDADRAPMLNARAQLVRCQDRPCRLFSVVLGPVSIGAATLKSAIEARVWWDGTNDRFLARIGSDPDTPLGYGSQVNDASTPARPLAAIGVRARSADCSSGRNSASIRASFGRVVTNTAAVACDVWPIEVRPMLAKLPVPEGVCLKRILASGPSAYDSSSRSVVQVSPAPRHGELHALAHEICHAHQHRELLDTGLGDALDHWPSATEAGSSFGRICEPVGTECWFHPDCGSSHTGCYANALEAAADFCAMWYNPGRTHPSRSNLRVLAPKHSRWADRWLPR